jgi:hypothetical protein
VFLTRWVPAPERLERPRTGAPPPAPEALDTYREMLRPPGDGAVWRLAKRSAVGLAVFGVAGWMWRRNVRDQAAQGEPVREEPADD